MSGLTEAKPDGGWRIVEIKPDKLKSSHQVGINHDIVRSDIANLIVKARSALYANALGNRRGLTLTFAATEAVQIASSYRRKSILVAASERAKATADYWNFIADSIGRLK